MSGNTLPAFKYLNQGQSPEERRSHTVGDERLAGKTGAATILGHFRFWVEHNQRKEKNCLNGKYWTYQTIKEIQHHYPGMTLKQVRVAVARLERLGLIESGFHQKNPFDRTKWYTLTEKSKLN